MPTHNAASEYNGCQLFNLLKFLSTGAAITPVSAMINFGIMALPRRIYEISEWGLFTIDREMKTLPNGKRYMSYSLHKNDLKYAKAGVKKWELRNPRKARALNTLCW